LINALRAVIYMVGVEATTYPLEWLERSVGLLLLGAIAVFGAPFFDAIGGQHVDISYASYVLVALAVLQLFDAVLTRFQSRLRNQQLAGVLEICLTTRTPFWQYVLALPAFDMLTALLQSTALFALAIHLGDVGIEWGRLAVALVILCIGVASYAMLGLIAAAGILIYKRGDPVTKVVHLAALIFGGTFFPRSVLPDWLATLGGWLPIAPTLDSMRTLLFTSEPLADGTWYRLIIILAVTAVVAIPTFRYSLVRARRDGSLSHY
jgi:ABC-2 type transport system permease protein